LNSKTLENAVNNSDIINTIAEMDSFYSNNANFIEWDVGEWVMTLPDNERPDLSESYREQHDLQTTGDSIGILLSIFGTWRKAGKNANLRVLMNKDAELMTIQRGLFDMNAVEICLLKLFDILDRLQFFNNNVNDEVKMFLAYNDGNCAISNKDELSKYGNYSKQEMLKFLNLCNINKQKILTQGVAIINEIAQSKDVNKNITQYLTQELNKALDS